ncbi:MAG: hypothetical protein D3925_02130, partial [Candidatus Electrothrix sp. AR5]|nr:hypothetical protein [Candidatus Electrothrix sp. AR5]
RFRRQGTTSWQTKTLSFVSGYIFRGTYTISGSEGIYEYQFRASDADTASGDRTNTTDWSSTSNFTVTGAGQLSKPVLTNPAGDTLNVSATTQNFDWNSVSGATRYRILVLEYGQTGDMVNDGMNSSCRNNTTCFTATTTSSSYSGFNLKKDIKYYWLVWAGSSDGLEDSEPGADIFTTRTSVVDNKPPVFVSGSATPSSITSGEQITFESTWNDPESKSIVDVQVRFRKQGTTTWQTQALGYVSGYTFSGSYTISGSAGTYEYQFKASDADTASGTRTNTTSWLAGGTFEVQDGPQPFSAPHLIFPENGAVDLPYDEISFDWSDVTDGTNYRIVISKNSSFDGFDDSSRECDITCQTFTITSATSYTVADLKPETTYYWHVRANSSTLSKTSDWSAYYSFTTKKEQVTLTVTTSGAERGVVSSTPDGINCGTDCLASYPTDTSVTLTATAHAGSVFRGWGGDCSGADETCVVSMDKVKNVSAVFGDENARSFKVWVDQNGKDGYDEGEELKNSDIRYRVVPEGGKAADIPLKETKTDELGLVELFITNDNDTIYIEKEYGKKEVVSSRSSHLFSDEAENPYSSVDNVRYEFVMASDIRKDEGKAEVLGEYFNFPGEGNSFADELKKDDGSILVKLGHPKWQWNLSICFEDPHIEAYYEDVKSELLTYSDYLYNYTDGYSGIKNIIFIKGAQQRARKTWKACDIRVVSEASLRANAHLTGYKTGYGRIEMKRRWSTGWGKILGHESGHYLFSFRDEYMTQFGYENYLKDLPETWPYRWENNGGAGETNQFPGNYGVMQHQATSHELSDSGDYLSISGVQKCWMKPELSEKEESLIEDIVVDFTDKAHGLAIKKYLAVLYKFDSEDGEEYLQSIVNDENEKTLKAIRDYVEYHKRVSMQYYSQEKSTWWTFKEKLDKLVATYLFPIYLSNQDDVSDKESILEKFTSVILNNFTVPPNASKENGELVGGVYEGLTGKPCDHIFSKPVNVEYYKRPGPNEMLNNQLNIINWEPVDNEEESILAA